MPDTNQPNPICLRCRHYLNPNRSGDFTRGFCNAKPMVSKNLSLAKPIPAAREICDKEGDGHFVYFEPKHLVTAKPYEKAAA